MRAEITLANGLPAFRIDGEIQTGSAFYSHSFDPSPGERAASARRIAEFRDAGIHVYSFGLGLGPFCYKESYWTGEDTYAPAVLDEVFEFVLSIDPAAKMLPRVGIDGPDWWKERYPDEIAVGWKKERGFYREDWLQSFSSKPWRRDAGKALTQYIRHIESKFSEHVIGYHVCAEASHEWSYGWWGSLHDYGPAQVQGFREWLGQRYQNDVSLLRAAWNDTAVTFAAAEIPSPESRCQGDYFEFIDPAQGRQRIDYLDYHNWVVSDAIKHFAGVVKRTAGRDKLCGVFYGYYFLAENALLLDVGHRALANVLASDDVDFISCPYNYRERQIGGAAITQAVAGSIRLRGKVCYVEDDTRTFLTTPDREYGRAENLSDTIAILKRNYALAADVGGSLWWMEQSAGWFSCPELMSTIGQLEAFGKQLLDRTVRSASAVANAEIAVFVSDASASYLRFGTSLVEPLVNAFAVEHLPRLGAPYDVFLTSDIEELHARNLLKNYKLCIFLNTPYLSQRERAVISERVTCAGRTVFWIHCPGYITESGLSLQAMSALIGIELAEEGLGGRIRLAITDFKDDITRGVPRNSPFGPHEPIGPLLWCVDEKARHLGEMHCMPAYGKDWKPKVGVFCNKTGLAAKELQDWRSVWCGVPNPPSSLLRGVARKAGVNVYLDSDDVVYANALFLAVHARYAGTRTISLPKTSTVIDAFTGENVARNARSFEVQLGRGDTGIWLLE